MKLCIENAHVDDIGIIHDFQLAHALEVEGMQLDSMRVMQGVSEVFEKTHHGFYIVARDLAVSRQAVASLLITKEWSDWRGKDVWWVQSVFVVPEYRRKGLFSGMYAFIENEAKQQNVCGLRLYVEKNNLVAKRLYTKLGMSDKHYDMFECLFERH